jgi:hypothetical protein
LSFLERRGEERRRGEKERGEKGEGEKGVVSTIRKIFSSNTL